MAAAAIPLAVGGTVLQLAAQEEAMKARRKMGRIKAQQLEDQADKAVAVSQRQALEEKRKADLLASRALALSAASGAGVSDPTNVKILTDIEGESAYRQSIALYEGEQEAKTLRTEANLTRAGLEYEQKATRLNQLSTVLSGAASIGLAGKYGGPNYQSAAVQGGYAGGAGGYG